MSREVQVRFCERRGVRFPPPTLPVIHCVSERQAREVLAALQERMSEVGLALHPDKTRIVYCQDARRRGSHEHTSFTFLGYGFRGRRVRTRSGRITTGFVPAISKDALNKISSAAVLAAAHPDRSLRSGPRAADQPGRAGLDELLVRREALLFRMEVKDP